MINGAHILLYTHDADADRAFLRDVLGFPSVDVGGGWLIFSLPPAEAAVHPAEEGPSDVAHGTTRAELYLMCDDLRATMDDLAAKGVRCTDVHEERWGIRTTIALPSGSELGLYQPKHPTALDLPSS